MKLNTPTALRDKTHEGAPIRRISPLDELKRFAACALMWEDSFYESGQASAERIKAILPSVSAVDIAALAIDARERMYLRHVPLFLVRELARRKGTGTYVAETLERVIQRADELSEFLAMYWRDKREPLSKGVKRGLAAAFQKFSPYQLAKYHRDGAIRLRDVLFMVHAKPKDEAQAETWRQLVDGTLPSPDTWEVALSRGDDKEATWERLLRENQLGGLATLRNLRNMTEAQVDDALIRERLSRGTPRTLPWQYIAAAKHAPRFEPEIEQAMLSSLQGVDPLPGVTAILVDVSGSMDDAMSGKSEMTRMDAAAGLAILLREKCHTVHAGTFSNHYAEVPARRGFALRDAIVASQPHYGTLLFRAMQMQRNKIGEVDRLIIITDGQSADGIAHPYGKMNYLLNIAAYQNGVGYDGDKWTVINGFSERVVDFIAEHERLLAAPPESATLQPCQIARRDLQVHDVAQVPVRRVGGGVPVGPLNHPDLCATVPGESPEGAAKVMRRNLEPDGPGPLRHTDPQGVRVNVALQDELVTLHPLQRPQDRSALDPRRLEPVVDRLVAVCRHRYEPPLLPLPGDVPQHNPPANLLDLFDLHGASLLDPEPTSKHQPQGGAVPLTDERISRGSLQNPQGLIEIEPSPQSQGLHPATLDLLAVIGVRLVHPAVRGSFGHESLDRGERKVDSARRKFSRQQPVPVRHDGRPREAVNGLDLLEPGEELPQGSGVHVLRVVTDARQDGGDQGVEVAPGGDGVHDWASRSAFLRRRASPLAMPPLRPRSLRCSGVIASALILPVRTKNSRTAFGRDCMAAFLVIELGPCLWYK